MQRHQTRLVGDVDFAAVRAQRLCHREQSLVCGHVQRRVTDLIMSIMSDCTDRFSSNYIERKLQFTEKPFREIGYMHNDKQSIGAVLVVHDRVTK